MLINLALLHVMPPAQMAGSTLVAADAAKVVLGAQGELAMTIFALISVAAIVLEDPVHSLTGFLGLACVGLVYFLIGRRPRPQIA